MTPRIAVVGLVVSDMAASLAFYRKLGLDIPPGADAEPHASIQLEGVQIAWDLVEVIHSFDPGWTKPAGGPGASLAFDCGEPAEVDRVFAELVADGYEGHLEPWDAFWGMRYATLRDPDGHGVDLFALLPTA
jgi:catechol 2,3-dioxygenase-like lactoylglutathione lyase family enzyme